MTVAVSAAGLLASGCSLPQPAPLTAAPVRPMVTASVLPPGDDVTLVRIVDGDTIVVSGDRRVRLIGIDTPETKHPDKGIECYGAEAAARAAQLLPPGEPVRLEYDVERIDRYGRTLAYLHRRRDGLHVNAALVAEGYAKTATYPPNVAHADEFAQLQRAARDASRGLWSGCESSSPTGPATPLTPVSCDPSYPHVCIPPPPPVLSCADIEHRRFEVRPPYVHGLDGDGDGTGCQ